ncbi:MAG: CheR family methyltransferase [Planctomycetota bacterium]
MPTDQASEPSLKKPKLSASQFTQFKDLIYRETGISLGDNKREFIQSRLSKRLRSLEIDSFADYFSMLRDGGSESEEMQEMVNRVTTNKTNFFRENHHFEHLRDVVFRRLIDEADHGLRPKRLRIWCAASSTGEEPYSLAITVSDMFSHLKDWDVRILATDIDTNVLQRAEEGVYMREAEMEIPPEILQKHFSVRDNELVVRPATKQYLTFRQLNLLHETWPFRTQFDAIFIRNVLIYFDQKTQNDIMSRMAKHLVADGSLFIGHSESLSELSNIYTRRGKTVYQHAGYDASKAPQPSAVTRRPPPPPVKPPLKRIVVGDVEASRKPLEISTVLGSCVAVCLFDRANRIGGMNHFALPNGDGARGTSAFGVHAMELLINKIMQLGGDRLRLQAKVFGGAKVIEGSGPGCIGDRNAAFIENFLQTESIPMVAKHLGGDRGMQVHFVTDTARCRVKLLDRSTALDANRAIETALQTAPPEPETDITLF